MMNKKYLMKGFAALALVAGFASCVKDVESIPPAQEEAQAKENAELQLGITIPTGQTWNMASQVTANISVNLGLDQEYTVAVYDKNPLFNSDAKFFAMETVKEGKSISTSFTLPDALQKVYIAAYDSKNRSIVDAVSVENGQIVANLGGNAAGSRTMRAAENASVYPQYVRTLESYLNPTLDDVKEVILSDNQNAWKAQYISLGTPPTLDAMRNYTAITDAIITDDTSQGNHTLSDKNYNPEEHFPGNGDGKHYRVAAGTEVTEIFNINATENVVNDAVIYVEGTLHLNGNTLNGPTLVVGSGGKIILDGTTNMSNFGRVIVMAGGSIEAPEGTNPDFNVNNGGACYNAGTINFNGQLNVNGSKVYNNGTVIVDVLRNTSGGHFTNFGHITARTNTIQGDAYNSTIVNGCYLHFTENAGTGPLTLLDNSRIDCDGQLYMTGASTMYNLSEINAGSIYCQDATINGPTAQGSFSIVKTSKFLVSYGGDLTVTNNAYVDCDPDEFYNYQNVNYKKTMSENDYQYSGAAWIIKNNISHWTSENSSALIIPEGDCSGMGNNPGGGGGKIYGDPAVYTYAFEDQTAGSDYDMNDVVLKVSYVVAEEGTGENAGKVIYDKTRLNATLVAAGATYNIKIKIGETYLFNGTEIHEKLGVNPGVMVNTGNGKAQNGVTPQSDIIAIPSGWNGKFEELPVSIEVLSTGKTYSYPNTDPYPHAVMIPVDWRWPLERIIITEAYPGTSDAGKVTINGVEYPENSFTAWAATRYDLRTDVMKSWYNENNADKGKTMTNTSPATTN